MRLAERVAAIAVCSAVLGFLADCGNLTKGGIAYGPGRGMGAGYWVEYLDASPAPGTFLAEGTTVKFDVKVRYSLMRSETGRIQLQFANQVGETILKGQGTAIDISRCKTAIATISQQVTVPKGLWQLALYVFVVPDGERHPGGELRVSYLVGPQ